MSETKEKTNPESDSSSESADGHKSGSSVYSLLFPADPAVWNEARKLASDSNLKVEDLAACSSQDPAIVLELLKSSNALFFSGGKSPITSIKTAIVRLGSENIVSILEKIREREKISNPRESYWFEVHRSRNRRTAIISRMLSEILARTLSDDCQAISLFSFAGEMLAVLQLHENYTLLADENSRSTVLYRLIQDHKFDCEKIGLSYIRRNGVPEASAFALDREARAKSGERAIMRQICAASAEMVDAFDNERWDKIAPGKSLPPKSYIRSLGISESQYLKIFERASEYLFSSKVSDENKRLQPLVAFNSGDGSDQIKTEDNNASSSLANDINSLLGELPDVELFEEQDLDTEFGLSDSASKPFIARSEQSEIEIPEVALSSNKMEAMLSSLSNVFDQAKSSEEVLTQLLEIMVTPGPFEKSALIVVSKDRKKAVVVAARGPGIDERQMLMLNDPLSPLAQCFSKVQSFGNRKSNNSPFGSRAYALSPIDADHDSPVALYADCGSAGAISFEARRVFRMVVKLLNQKLPQVAGGIPVEI